jgi:hypothetical protein
MTAPTHSCSNAHPLLDHLVCRRQQRLRDGEAKGPGGLEVDDELKSGWLLNEVIQ